ncbi:MAG: BamA/TamA family outer membrane protein [Rhodothermales bacterium]
MLRNLFASIPQQAAIRLVMLTALACVVALPAEAQYFRYGKNKVHSEDRTWFYLQSRHFTVYWHDGNEDLADFTIRAAEDAYVQVSRLFDFRPTRTIPIILYEDHGEFAVTNAVDLPTYTDGIGGVTELFKNRIALPFTGDMRDFRRVLHHEIVHAMLNEYFYDGTIQTLISGGPTVRLPLWFNEGLAEYAALGWDTQSDMFVREAVLSGHLADIRRLSGYFAYRGGQGVWDYVAEQYGQEKIAEILRRVKTLRNVDQAFERSIGMNLDELSARWHRALREIHFPEVTARESMADLGRALITREHGFYNVSPALSPLGDRMVYITTTQGLFDIYLTNTGGEAEPVRLIAGQTSRDFEALPVLTPGLSWAPDARRVAAAVRRGSVESVAILDVRTGQRRHIDVPAVQQILSLDWSPDGSRLALSASTGQQSDIFVLDLATETLSAVTDDVFSDHEPTWQPDSRGLVFHSDRGEPAFDRFNLFLIDLDSTDRIRRLTDHPTWDSWSARFGASVHELYYLSDANGIPNIHIMDLETGRSRPVTDLDVGVMQLAVSGDGRTLAAVALREGVPSIHIVRDLAPRRLAAPRPNVWAQRVEPPAPPVPGAPVINDSAQMSPALALANETARTQNPFLRDILDGRPYVRGRDRVALLAGGALLPEEAPRTPPPPPDSLFGGVTVDFETLRNHGRIPPSADVQALGEPAADGAHVDSTGRYVPRRYKLRFTPDIVYGAAGYDPLYGVQGVTQMMFSDMLGDHRFMVATNLLLDLRNSDYLISYDYLPRRLDWSTSLFHVSRLLADFERTNPTYYRYRQYGARLAVRFPFDKFHRLDAEVGVVGVSQADITDVARPTRSRTLLIPRITFTRDNAVPGFLYPVGGSRFAMALSGSPVALSSDRIRFGTVLMDARTYLSAAGNRLVWAFRVSGAASFGPHPQVFYTSGVQNWINRDFDDVNGFPISDVSDFVFATPMSPLRGFDINAANGSYFALANAEFRFPLAGDVVLFPRIEGLVFVDAGSVWGGRTTTAALDDILAGTGFGVRTLFLGWPVRLDFAWPFDGTEFGDRRTYISVGLDF